jgi:hypothetical protein
MCQRFLRDVCQSQDCSLHPSDPSPLPQQVTLLGYKDEQGRSPCLPGDLGPVLVAGQMARGTAGSGQRLAQLGLEGGGNARCLVG